MRWTLPNILTLARICLTPVIALLPFIQGYWPKVIAFLIFLAASASDVVDGYLARRRNEVSELGQLLDPVADKLLLFATLIPIFWLTRHPTILYGIPWWGSLPVWVALLLVGRELAITAFRFFAKRRGVVIPAAGAGKLKAVVQNVFIGATIAWFAWRDALLRHGWTGRLEERLLAGLEARFKHLGRPMPVVNRTQAEVPEGATVLPNPRGTAPGLWVEDARGRVVVLLPGVPREMRGLLVEEVLPRLVARHAGEPRVVLSRTVRTTGIAESALAERVGPIEPEIAPLTLAYLPSVEGVDLRVTAWGLGARDAEARLAAVVERLRAAVGEHGYGEDAAGLAAGVLDAPPGGRHRLGVAESCTGGMIAERVTNIPGASATFIGGVVAYADVVKTAALKVPIETLETHGAVSEQTVRAMAEGAQRLFSADCTMAVTGIAGPGGGTPDKPVGTVWLAARVHTATRAVKRVFPGDRDEIRRRAAQAALDLLRRVLTESEGRSS